MLERERSKLFNKLCKICNQYRVIPESMNIPDCSKGSVEVERGGLVNISQSTYEGRPVALKVVRAYTTNDLEVILSVSVPPALSRPSERMDCRDSVARELLGNTSGIPTSYHSLE